MSDSGGSDEQRTAFAASLIGSFRLIGPDGKNALPRGRRARALLAYLIVEHPRPVTRDRLATLLWSDRGEDQARASLRQSFHELRELTGPVGPLLVSRSAASIAPGVIATDIEAIDRLVAAQDARGLAERLEAALLPLLSDLDDISSDFDDWLRIERDRYRRKCREGAVAVAQHALEQNDPIAARRLIDPVLGDDPLDEATAVIAMRAAHACGDRIGMHRVFIQLRQALREELAVVPAQATSALHDRLLAAEPPARSARPTPYPGKGTQEPAGDPAPTAADRVRRRGVVRFWNRSWPWAVALVVLLLASSAVLQRAARRPDTAPSVLVEPLHAGDADATAQALRQNLPVELSRTMTGTAAKIEIVDAASSRGHSGARPMLVVSGDAVTSRDALYVTIRLLAGPRRTLVWSRAFSSSPQNVDGLGQQIANGIGRELNYAYRADHAKLLSSDPDLARVFLAGIDYIGKDLDEAARYFRQTVTLRPNWAPGWGSYAATLGVMSTNPQADPRLAPQAMATARHALALDPKSSTPYFAMALALNGGGKWLERESAVRAGLAAEPDSFELLIVRSSDLAVIGRLQDALASGKRSLELDHFLGGKYYFLAELMAETGDLEGAQAMNRRAQTLWPDVIQHKQLEFELAYRWGDPAKAMRLLTELPQGSAAHMAEQAAFLRWRAHPTPETNAAAADALRREYRSTGATPALVQQLAWLGRIDEAYARAEELNAPMDRIPDEWDSGATWYRDYLAPFRADPRFMKLAARIGLARVWVRTGLWPDFCADPRLPYDCRAEARRALAGKPAAREAS